MGPTASGAPSLALRPGGQLFCRRERLCPGGSTGDGTARAGIGGFAAAALRTLALQRLPVLCPAGGRTEPHRFSVSLLPLADGIQSQSVVPGWSAPGGGVSETD